MPRVTVPFSPFLPPTSSMHQFHRDLRPLMSIICQTPENALITTAIAEDLCVALESTNKQRRAH